MLFFHSLLEQGGHCMQDAVGYYWWGGVLLPHQLSRAGTIRLTVYLLLQKGCGEGQDNFVHITTTGEYMLFCKANASSSVFLSG